MEITQAIVIFRDDLKTTHAEADNILAHKMNGDCCYIKSKKYCIISDDKDVFVLLLYHNAVQ